MFEGLFQPTHLILILVIALIVLGPGKLPEVSRGIGKSIREFRKATREITQGISAPINEVKQPITEMKQQVESIRRLPSDTLAGLKSGVVAPNGTASSGSSAGNVATVQGSAGAKICPACSMPNPADNRFCGGCGAKLS